MSYCDLTSRYAELAAKQIAEMADIGAAIYCSTDKRDFDETENAEHFIEIIASPYSVSLRDERALPSLADVEVNIYLTTRDTRAAEDAIRRFEAATFSYPEYFVQPSEEMPIYYCVGEYKGAELRDDGLITATFSILLTVKPFITKEP